MARSFTSDRSGDEAYTGVDITDFSGGRITDIDPLDLPLNASPDCLNVKPRLGSAFGRGGYRILATVKASTNQPDGIGFFYDVNGLGHIAVWADGGIYGVSLTGTVSTLNTGLYNVGNRIATTNYNNVLYWSDGVTIFASGTDRSGIRKWDGITAETMLVGSVPSGSLAPPAAKVLATYAGSIIAANCVLTDGTIEPHIIRPSAVNDATNFPSALAQNVAPGVGGEINCVVPFNVSTESINLAATLFVGKTIENCWGMQGALGSLTENVLNISAGVLDGHTAKFVPGPVGQAGMVCFLGTDGQVYVTNGVTADSLSKDRVSQELANLVTTRREAAFKPLFYAVNHDSDSQYLLDMGGGIQYPFDYKRQNWTYYSGWPSGHWVRGSYPTGKEMLLCATNIGGNIVICECNTGLTDNGALISTYWSTPDLVGDSSQTGANAGDKALQKLWGPLYLDFSTDSGTFVADLSTDQNEGQTATASTTITGTALTGGVYGVARYGTGVYGASTTQTILPYSRHFHIAKQNTPPVPPEYLKGTTCRVKISQTTVGKTFQLNGIRLKYLLRGIRGSTKEA